MRFVKAENDQDDPADHPIRAEDEHTGIEHLADMFIPLYMWRASAFMSHTALESPAVVQARLDALCETFERLKPALVASWPVEV